MPDWMPKPKRNFDVMSLNLSEEEGFVFSRVDGKTSVQNLKYMTGLSLDRLEYVLNRLIVAQAIHSKTISSEHAAVTPVEPVQQKSVTPRSDPEKDRKAGSRENDNNSEIPVESRNYRRLFETKFHPLDNEEREKLAHLSTGSDLCALCYDPDSRVIKALFENSRFGLTQARLIAAHHRNPVGLDKLAYHLNFLQDEAVQKFLLRNVQTSNFLMNRMTMRKPLLHLYQMVVSGDVAAKVKRQVHKILRTKFQSASGDEAAALIFKTEGRCLTMLTGVPLNGKTIARLCSHTYTSMFLIQNLARWPTTHPKILMHLFRQPMVNRTPNLRNMILQHPNCPSQLKN